MKQKIFPKTALFSVSNKKGLVPFASFLEKNGTKIIASGGTAAVLKKNGIKVKKVSSLTGFPEIFGGRVKTINPHISGGILGKRDLDAKEAKKKTKFYGLIWWFVTSIRFRRYQKTPIQP